MNFESWGGSIEEVSWRTYDKGWALMGSSILNSRSRGPRGRGTVRKLTDLEEHRACQTREPGRAIRPQNSI